MAKTIGELKRNDVRGAVAYARERYEKDGALAPDDAQSLAMLQDDPAELFAELRRLRDEMARRPTPR